MRIWSTHSKKHGLNGRPGPAVHEDLGTREFIVHCPNTLWLTDITEHHTEQGKLYLCGMGCKIRATSSRSCCRGSLGRLRVAGIDRRLVGAPGSLDVALLLRALVQQRLE